MTDTPVWFMDVDGVLNFFPRGTPPKDTKIGKASPFVGGGVYEGQAMFPITWSTSILKRIVDMHDSGIVHVKWLTTWGRGANFGLSKMLGLPELEVVADPEEHPYRSMGWHSWWKAHAVRHYLEKYNPSKIVWTDDDLKVHRDNVRDIHEMVPSLMISPQDHRGLTHHQLDKIEAFLVDSNVQIAVDGIR